MCTPREERLTALAIPAIMQLIDEVGYESAIAIVLMPFDDGAFAKDYGEWTLQDVFDNWSPCHDELR